MADVFKLSDWNNLIDAINDVRANPPADTDCEPLPPIDQYPNTTAFNKREVTRVRDAIAATCGDISFPSLDGPQLIKRDLLTQIQDALGMAWCNCEPDDDCNSEDGQIITLRSDPWNVYTSFDPSDLSGPCGYPPAPEDFGGTFDALALLSGPIAIPGRIFRSFSLYHTLPNTLATFPLGFGPINCDGTCDLTGLDPALMFQTAWSDASCDIGDTCETCGNKVSALQAATPRLVQVQISAALAACVDC